jgi:hypothetical protein
LEILRGRDHSEDLGVDERIILKRILGIQEPVADSCEHDDESSDSVKGG